MTAVRSPTPPQQRAVKGRRPRGLLSLDWQPLVLCVPLALVSMAAMFFVLTFEDVTFPWLFHTWPELDRVYSGRPLPTVFFAWQAACGTAAVVWMAAALAGLMFRRRWALRAVRTACAVAYLLVGLYVLLVMIITGLVAEAVTDVPEPPPGGFMMESFYWRCRWLAPAACLALAAIMLHVLSWRRAVINLYCRQREQSPAPGDRVVENIRTHGPDPRFRKSVFGSTLAHLLVIVIIPLLLTLRAGCGGPPPFRDPLGSGKPAVAVMKLKQKQKKKRKKYILSKYSPIIYSAPDLHESDLSREVEQESRNTYVADTSAVHGAMGTGGGDEGGWFGGSPEGKIRFVRLEYDGPDWDDGTEPDEAADVNFLAEFHRRSGLGADKVARQGESMRIAQLRDYQIGDAPRFVYMTGSGRIALSPSEVQALRDYIKEGGMIFADAGSRQWDREFRALANSLFPGNPLRIIGDDDPIFRIPYTFPNGPPPLWFHGGVDTWGIKYRGRWAVFYFPGDLNDAWKTGHSGTDRDKAEAAVCLGVNVVYYATTHYLEANRKYRK